jgi:hypothetical protein
MANQLRLILLGLVLLLLAGCSGAFGGYGTTTEPVSEELVARSLQFIDEGQIGPVYSVSFSIPDEWVGKIETRNTGNTIYIDYLPAEGQRAPLFFVEALSQSQFWEQIGSYPGIYKDIVSTRDTHFIYFLPRDAYYSGLSKDLFQVLSAQVPQVISSFQAQAVQ